MSVLESLKLGAFDLQKNANKNLAIGFGVALLLSLMLIGGNGVFAGGNDMADTASISATGPVTLEDFETEQAQEEPPPQQDVVPPPPPPPAAIALESGSGSEGRMGNLVATTEEVSGPDIADMSEIDIASLEGGGDGIGKAIDIDNLDIDPEVDLGSQDVEVAPKQELYPDFVANANPPQYSIGELQGNATYPPIAQENNLEGKVVMMVFLSKTGKVDKVQILKSDNSIFDKEAIAAVKRTTFSPATQNGLGITYKLPVTVKFKLN